MSFLPIVSDHDNGEESRCQQLLAL